MLVYMITNKINNKKYIGITTKTLEKRIKSHINAFKTKKHFLIYKAFDKYGFENFIFEKIDFAKNLKELKEKEIFYINKYNTHYLDGYGYNMTYGGDLNAHLIGNLSPVSKINWDDVYKIIEMLKKTDYSFIEIRDILNLNINERTISYINKGEQWKITGIEYPIRTNPRSLCKMGLNNPRSKLDRELVLKIIYELRNTNETQTSIAKKFNIHYNTVNEINRCLKWKHIHSYQKNIRLGL